MNNSNNFTNIGLILVDYIISLNDSVYISSIYALNNKELSYKWYIFYNLIIYDTHLLNAY